MMHIKATIGTKEVIDVRVFRARHTGRGDRHLYAVEWGGGVQATVKHSERDGVVVLARLALAAVAASATHAP